VCPLIVHGNDGSSATSPVPSLVMNSVACARVNGLGVTGHGAVPLWTHCVHMSQARRKARTNSRAAQCMRLHARLCSNRPSSSACPGSPQGRCMRLACSTPRVGGAPQTEAESAPWLSPSMHAVTTASACSHAGTLVRPAHGVTWLRNDRDRVWRLHVNLELDCHASPHVARSCRQDAAACASAHHTACGPLMRSSLSLHIFDSAYLPIRVLSRRAIQPRPSRAALTASHSMLHAV
jgi:hypothetical protein